MIKTSKEYQDGYAQFMLCFQGVTFTDDKGNKIRKKDIFDSIYENHIMVDPTVDFKLDKQISYHLLSKNNHPSIRTVPREYFNFNETEVLRDATRKVMSKKAIAIVRQKIKTEEVNIFTVIDIVTNAMERLYNNYHDIDKEIENTMATF
jgi:DNA-binding winged helix-turn-helix (wHTH) protein